jgi:hypothetical protein
MRNTTKLKSILLLYKATLDLDEDNNLHLTLIDKRDNATKNFIEKSYTVLMRKAFSFMLKQTATKTRKRRNNYYSYNETD